MPTGAQREEFYEKRLLEGLAWHCAEAPTPVPGPAGRAALKWQFPSAKEVIDDTAKDLFKQAS